MGRQWQLHQNAVNFRIVIQGMDPGEQLSLGHAGIVFFEHGVNTVFFARLDLVAYVNLRCLAVADQNDGQAGLATLCGQGCGAFGNVGADLFREQVAVDDFCGHGL